MQTYLQHLPHSGNVIICLSCFYLLFLIYTWIDHRALNEIIISLNSKKVSPYALESFLMYYKNRMSRLGKSCEQVQFHERERTKRIVYSVIYGVGKESLIQIFYFLSGT